MSLLDPPGPELVAKNLRILAERLKWPDGAVEACELAGEKFPNWTVYWNTGSHVTQPGFYGARRRKRWEEGLAYGETIEELLAMIESWPWKDPTYGPLLSVITRRTA